MRARPSEWACISVQRRERQSCQSNDSNDMIETLIANQLLLPQLYSAGRKAAIRIACPARRVRSPSTDRPRSKAMLIDIVRQTRVLQRQRIVPVHICAGRERSASMLRIDKQCATSVIPHAKMMRCEAKKNRIRKRKQETTSALCVAVGAWRRKHARHVQEAPVRPYRVDTSKSRCA